MNILVLYYSVYGHTLALAQAAQQGAQGVDGAEVVLRRAPEFADHEQAIAGNAYARGAWEQQKAIPECTLEDLKRADGMLIGSPTRYGNMIAQMKHLIDATASLWVAGELEGKPVSVFTSTATTHGGQESTLLSMMVPLLHLGMVIVGVPYSTAGMLHTEGRGGTPYGATTVAGQKNELVPVPQDLDIARAQGRRLAEITAKLAR